MNNLIQRLRQKMQGLQATPTRPQSPTTYVDPRLKQCTHVFLRCDRIRKPLQPPYEGPFKVLNRSDKSFTILLNGKEEIVSIDRLKAALVEETPKDSPNKSPTQLPTPITSTSNANPVFRPPSLDCSPSSGNILSSDTSSSTSRTTRSGRRVKFPERFVSYYHY